MLAPAMPEQIQPSAPNRRFEQVGALAFFAYALAQVTQELVLRAAPSDSDTAASYAFTLSSPDRFRAVFLYVTFWGLLLGYAAVYRRLRQSGWALAGLLLITLFLGIELVDRGLELVLAAQWQRAWLETPAMREALSSRIDVFTSVQLASYLPLLAAHVLGCALFAVAASGRDRWTRLARYGLVLNAVRGAVRLAAMFFGAAWLAPVADVIYLPLTLAHAIAVGLWLLLPHPAQET
ncbi:hypothetical protein FGE12_12235 [Aggregicoccus sp. 17bor-14]|uniref:hypothetical protein n=1 Tax=Myxococcaceae TaxID=31 RepID=UPI00129CF918|nr:MULTISPECIES: hypothetical protein [Myxococcaceae]MBF5043158.1 hypothetical protein [Simulacricoccus sp. 17bor-14]MRI88917.1 hypothetical protein [Aggregicoccus sp. 17bor-14]